MDVFELREQLVEEYKEYIYGFINISNPEISTYVDEQIAGGLLWPEPLIQLNPSFQPGKTINELVTQGSLHSECARIFRIQKGTTSEKTLRLHKHQEDALKTAANDENYVLTTGTGSGKSLTYIIPIVNHVLQRGSGKGIQAIIVYPMNALANSQLDELDKFINTGYPNDQGPITFARFTGQESNERKNEIRANPPDILLTNYVMLEMLLTRPEDRRSIIRSSRDLRFLVLDELHTYRGRQGADVAMLIRRLREAVEADHLQCVGTSATLASEGTYEDQQKEIAVVASLFFGAKISPENIIGETLTRTTEERTNADPEFTARLSDIVAHPNDSFPDEYEDFIENPLTSWIESTFGVTQESGTGRLVRATPSSILGENGAAQQLSIFTGVSATTCVQSISDCLMKGYEVQNPETQFPVFAFRLHQFISPGDTVYTTLEPAGERHITVNYQQFKPGDRTKVLLPLAFCRECGHEYYSVRVQHESETGTMTFTPRDFWDMLRGSDDQPGYIFLAQENPWPTDPEDVIERLPDDCLELHRGEVRVRHTRRKNLPEYIRVSTEGLEDNDGQEVVFIPAPFRFCLNCGVAYSSRMWSDFPKLSGLSAGGRSTSTTILSLATYSYLRQEDSLEKKARKLLSFTDNRQDAALQSGHFNDFVETSLLRAALFQAVRKTGEAGLRYDQLTQTVVDTLDLPMELYASDPEVRFLALNETNEALRDVLGYRLYRDLQRGWRVTAPNLEQCGLLKIDYLALDEVCAAEEIWDKKHPALTSASSQTREKVARVLLDYMRRELAIQVQYLNELDQERIRQRSNQRLSAPWAIDENERLKSAAILYPRSYSVGDFRGNVFLSTRGGFGLYLNNTGAFENYAKKLDPNERQQIICELLEALRVAGIVEVVDPPKDNKEAPGYQLKAAAMIWMAGYGTTPFHDPIRMPRLPEEGARTNHFFVKFYSSTLENLKGLRAREHTAQVPYEKREEREKEFRAGKLPIMFCSPTMELGIDISQLNVVNMRNVPPNPANYAQRSGRAGRSGQPALVFTYCAKGSPHDQYFFKRQERMVAGAVSPPRLDLANDDLVRAHIQAIWLAETDKKLGTSLKDILDLSGDPPSLDLIDEIQAALEAKIFYDRAKVRATKILDSLKQVVADSDWYSDDWLDQVLSQIPVRFEQACDRWRDLFQAALHQREQQDAIIRDASRTPPDRRRARNLRREAENQLELLLDSSNVIQSDFYVYRYFASEGFLPGYNFPRLPLSAYVPARRVRTDEGDYLSRPRFLAISEFGPRSNVYHEGSRYVINRVIIRAGRGEEKDEDLATERVKLCPKCGYLHQVIDGDGLDLCEHCQTHLNGQFRSLYRMQNVSTRRRDRINSDEEERFRLGYEIRTAVRFHQENGHVRVQQAEVVADGQVLARLSYGNAATIWRINLGWRRRKDQQQYGFVLDIERGYWQKNDTIEGDPEDPMSKRTQRVIPYVEDRKNSLLVEPADPLEPAQMASLSAAMKSAIQIVYQLEDNELSVEPLPTEDDRRVLLFYESAEGGAGVLRQLVQNPAEFAEVASQALQICHFDPQTGDDRYRGPQSEEDCEAACYDCLMSYYNQRDHRLLDRQPIRDILFRLREAEVKTSPVAITRDQHHGQLGRLAQSDLEEKWLNHLYENGYRLPSKAQHLFPDCSTRPDFLFESDYVAVFIDGPHHFDKTQRKRDAVQQSCLEDLGYTVLRFGVLDDWPQLIAENEYLFGKAT